MAVINALVDPYGVFASPITSLDPLRELETRVAKAGALSSGHWETIFFGSSRVHSGIDTMSPSLGGSPTFNAGFPATTTAELDLVVRFALEHNRPRRVVILTGVEQFTGAYDPRNRSRDRVLSGMDPETDFIENRLELLFGTRSLRASWGIIRALGSLGDGSRPYTNREGAFVNWTPSPQPLDALRVRLDRESEILAHYSWSDQRFEDLRRAVGRCLEAGVETWVVVSPVHALHLEMYRDVGVWEDFERMIGRLPVLAADGASVWSFAGYSGATAEPIPLDPEAEEMRGFYESSHFTHEIGDGLLAQIFGASPAGTNGLEGAPLGDAEAAAALLRKLQTDRASYRTERARDIAWLENG